MNHKIKYWQMVKFTLCAIVMLAMSCVQLDFENPLDPANGGSMVSYSINGGTGTAPSAQLGAQTRPVTLASGSGLSRSGFTFEGWNTNADGTGTNYAAGSSYTPAGNITLYARWSALPADPYTITFNPQNGTVSTASGTTGTDGRLTSLPTPPARDGYTFDGWFTSETGGTKVTTNHVFNSNVTIYAQWTEIPVILYTVTYNINGGTGTTPAAQTVDEGSSVMLSDGSGLTMSGFTFDGWNINENGTVTNYAADSYFTPSDNITLYAKWIALPHSHDWGEWKEITAAACTAPGVEIRVCGSCGDIQTKEIKSLGHDWEDWNVTKFATCTTPGEEVRTCKRNSEHKDTRAIAIDLNNHDWEGWTITLPTCTNKGDSTRVCKRNGDHKDIRVIEALGHDWEDWNVTKSATCTTPGDSVRVCKRDGDHKETIVIEALGHDWYDWVITPATCMGKGDSTRVCKRNCGHTETTGEVAQLTGILNGCHFNPDASYQEFTDTRNHRKYRTVEIGGKTWMAENLDYAGTDNIIGVCYNNEPDSCAKYGRLYTWAEAMNVQDNFNNKLLYTSSFSIDEDDREGICPGGWRLPSKNDWENLFVAGGGGAQAGGRLKSQNGDWSNNDNITDHYGFSALPGGQMSNDGTSFSDVSKEGYWWSATEQNEILAWGSFMGYQSWDGGGNHQAHDNHSANKSHAFSVRCIKR